MAKPDNFEEYISFIKNCKNSLTEINVPDAEEVHNSPEINCTSNGKLKNGIYMLQNLSLILRSYHDIAEENAKIKNLLDEYKSLEAMLKQQQEVREEASALRMKTNRKTLKDMNYKAIQESLTMENSKPHINWLKISKQKWQTCDTVQSESAENDSVFGNDNNFSGSCTDINSESRHNEHLTPSLSIPSQHKDSAWGKVRFFFSVYKGMTRRKKNNSQDSGINISLTNHTSEDTMGHSSNFHFENSETSANNLLVPNIQRISGLQPKISAVSTSSSDADHYTYGGEEESTYTSSPSFTGVQSFYNCADSASSNPAVSTSPQITETNDPKERFNEHEVGDADRNVYRPRRNCANVNENKRIVKNWFVLQNYEKELNSYRKKITDELTQINDYSDFLQGIKRSLCSAQNDGIEQNSDEKENGYFNYSTIQLKDIFGVAEKGNCETRTVYRVRSDILDTTSINKFRNKKITVEKDSICDQIQMLLKIFRETKMPSKLLELSIPSEKTLLLKKCLSFPGACSASCVSLLNKRRLLNKLGLKESNEQRTPPQNSKSTEINISNLTSNIRDMQTQTNNTEESNEIIFHGCKDASNMPLNFNLYDAKETLKASKQSRFNFKARLVGLKSSIFKNRWKEHNSRTNKMHSFKESVIKNRNVCIARFHDFNSWVTKTLKIRSPSRNEDSELYANSPVSDTSIKCSDDVFFGQNYHKNKKTSKIKSLSIKNSVQSSLLMPHRLNPRQRLCSTDSNMSKVLSSVEDSIIEESLAEPQVI